MGFRVEERSQGWIGFIFPPAGKENLESARRGLSDEEERDGGVKQRHSFSEGLRRGSTTRSTDTYAIQCREAAPNNNY